MRSDNKIVPFLRKHGPSRFDELPVTKVSVEIRRDYGVRRILLTGSQGSVKRKGRQVPIWYIDQEHDPKDVVRRYIDENLDTMNYTKSALTQLFNGHSKELGAAWQSIADEYDTIEVDTGGANQLGGTCSLCGKDYSRSLAAHLKNGCEAS